MMELFRIVKTLILPVCLSIFRTNIIVSTFRQKQMSSDVNGAIYRICTDPWCEQFSPEEVKNMFPGVFLTKEKYGIHKNIYNESRRKYLQAEGVKDVNYILGLDGDGDSCCATTYEAHINTTLTNIEGTKRSIVHMTSVEPPMYQFIPHAYCEASVSGGCDGICVLEYVTLTFLVYDPVAKMMLFDQFLLPGYCSCKRVLV